MDSAFEDRSGDGVPEDCQYETFSCRNNEVPYVLVPENYNPELQSPHLNKQWQEHSANWLFELIIRQRKKRGEYVPCSAKQSGKTLPNNLVGLLTDELARIGVIDKEVGGNGKGDKNRYRVRSEYMDRFKLFPITMKVALRKLERAANE